MSELLPDCKLSVFGNYSKSPRPRGQSMVLLRFMYTLVRQKKGKQGKNALGSEAGGAEWDLPPEEMCPLGFVTVMNSFCKLSGQPFFPHYEELLERHQISLPYGVHHLRPEHPHPSVLCSTASSSSSGIVQFSGNGPIQLFRPDPQHDFHFPILSFFLLFLFTLIHTPLLSMYNVFDVRHLVRFRGCS